MDEVITTKGAAAKEAGMRVSPQSRADRGRASETLTDERLEGWHPARISDRKLIELATRLEKVRRLGDAFADVGFSPQARQRLRRIAPAQLLEGLGVGRE